MSAENDTITVSNSFPLFLRILLGILAIAMMVLLLRELGPGLWPFNIASLFFGIIVVGGMQVLLAFILFVVAAPDTVWTFRPGFIEIEQRLYGRSDRITLPADGLAIDLVRNDDSDGPTTWHLDLDAGWPDRPGLQKRVRVLLTYLPRPLRRKADLLNRMRSPGFSTSDAAEAAMGLARSKRSENGPQ